MRLESAKRAAPTRYSTEYGIVSITTVKHIVCYPYVRNERLREYQVPNGALVPSLCEGWQEVPLMRFSSSYINILPSIAGVPRDELNSKTACEPEHDVAGGKLNSVQLQYSSILESAVWVYGGINNSDCCSPHSSCTFYSSSGGGSKIDSKTRSNFGDVRTEIAGRDTADTNLQTG